MQVNIRTLQMKLTNTRIIQENCNIVLEVTNEQNKYKNQQFHIYNGEKKILLKEKEIANFTKRYLGEKNGTQNIYVQ